MPPPDISNQLFDLAARFVNQTSRHLFLTGKAGTGKTTFLKYICEHSPKKMAVVAPTGVAAINAGGVTMHSFFQLPFGAFIPENRSWNGSSNINTPNTLFKNLRLSRDKRELMQELDLLIIDEVSMLRADMLDEIDIILRNIRKQPLLPFGGVQVLYIGDLFQLPPVVSNEEWEVLKDFYKSPFFFDAQVMQQSPPVYLELKKIYRQHEADFINLLNNIRNNETSEEDLQRLHQHYRPGYESKADENYITLTTHNVRVPEGVGPGIKQQPGAPFFGLTQQYSGGPKGRIFLPTTIPDDLGYYTRCLQYLDDAAGTYSHANDKKVKTVEPTSAGLIWSWYWVAGHEYAPIQGADAGSGTPPPSGGGGLTAADVQAMIDATLATFTGVKLGDKIALRTNSGMIAGIKGGGPTSLDAPIELIGKTDIHAWESFTLEKGE